MTQQTIANINRHFTPENFKSLTINGWRNILSSELSRLFSTTTYSINTEYLYRARPNLNSKNESIDFFKNTSELWAPPRKAVTKNGRCNTTGESLLYCSSNPTTTLFETKPETGTDLTIIEYKVLKEIGPLGAIGVNEIMTIREDFYSIFGKHFNESTEESKVLDDILSGIFKSKTANTELFPIYNITNAIKQIFLHNQKTGFIPKHLIPEKNVGLIYPSVETKKVLGANFVLDPKAVKNMLRPIVAYKYKILKRHDEHFYEIVLTHKTRKIHSNGEMLWQLKTDSKTEYITDLPLKNNAP